MVRVAHLLTTPGVPRCHPKTTQIPPSAGRWSLRVGRPMCDTILCQSTCGRDAGAGQKWHSEETMSPLKAAQEPNVFGLHVWAPFSRYHNLLQLAGAQKMYISWNLIFCLLSWVDLQYIYFFIAALAFSFVFVCVWWKFRKWKLCKIRGELQNIITHTPGGRC